MSTSIQSRQRRKIKPRKKNCLLLKKIKQSEELQQIASVMSNPEATEEVGNAGMMLFVILYGGRKEDTLGGLRFAKFMAMVSSSSSSQRTLIRA